MATKDDPAYANMMKKSFIMRKYHQEHPTEQIPQALKQPTILHKALTAGVLTTLAQLIIYPFDTIKTRKMAKNIKVDVAKFNLNQVITRSTYLGFFTGYISAISGIMCFLTLGEINFFLGVTAEGLIKTWIDMSKVSRQMANPAMDLAITKKVLPTAAFFSVARDLSARGSYILLVDFLMKKSQNWLAIDMNRRFHIYYVSAIVATLVSHPFDLVFAKLASQRQLRYNGLFGTLRTIYKDEGLGKFMSGFDYRLLYNLISMIIVGNSYDRFMQMTLEAF